MDEYANAPNLAVYAVASLFIRHEQLWADARGQIILYAGLLAAQKAGHVDWMVALVSVEAKA